MQNFEQLIFSQANDLKQAVSHQYFVIGVCSTKKATVRLRRGSFFYSTAYRRDLLVGDTANRINAEPLVDFDVTEIAAEREGVEGSAWEEIEAACEDRRRPKSICP